MIHTIAITKELFNNQNMINQLLNIMEVDSARIGRDFNVVFNPSDTSTKVAVYHPNIPGVNAIKLIRSTRTGKINSPEMYKSVTGYDAPADLSFENGEGISLPYSYGYTLYIEINPYKLLHDQEKHTVNLFIPTKSNVKLFEDAFSKMISKLFNRLNSCSLCYLYDFTQWNMRRIDYSFNLQFENENRRKIFQKLAHKTSSHIRTKPIRDNSQKIYNQSAAERNNSYKIICYDKRIEIENQEYLNSDEKRTLMSQAYGIQRYEVQIGYNGISSLMQRHKLPTRVAHNFLSLDIAYSELMDKYTKTVGLEFFYNRHKAKQLIRQTYDESMACKLINVIELIAQARSLDSAQKQFIEGGHFIKNSGKEVAGSKQTFRKYVKMIRAAGVNPVLIADVDKISQLENPVQQITEAYHKLTSA